VCMVKQIASGNAACEALVVVRVLERITDTTGSELLLSLASYLH
jgi:hypothetical protein